MSYDRKCLDLAEAFMSDYPKMQDREKRTKAIAQAIQNAIEDELTDYEREDEGRAMRAAYDAEKAADGDPTDPRSRAYAESRYEAADMERKRQREEEA